MTILPSTPGAVVVLKGPTLQLPGLVGMSAPLSFLQHKCILTQVGLALSTNQQFTQTIGGDIYTYVFGDRIGQLSLGGVAAAVSCDSAAPGHGLDAALSWYAANRLSNRGNANPVIFTLGRGATFPGYIVSFNAKSMRPDELMVQFEIGVALLPK